MHKRICLQVTLCIITTFFFINCKQPDTTDIEPPGKILPVTLHEHPGEITAYFAYPLNGGVVLIWKNPDDIDLEKIEVEFDPPFGYIGDEPANFTVHPVYRNRNERIIVPDGTLFRLANLTPYSITIKAVDTLGNKSEEVKLYVTPYNQRELDKQYIDLGSDIKIELLRVPEGVLEGNRINRFYISTFEITQEQYVEIMQNNPSKFIPRFPGDENAGTIASDTDTKQYPVDSVTWLDAATFCNKLSDKENLEKYYNLSTTPGGITTVTRNRNANGFRLPTLSQFKWAFTGANNIKDLPVSGALKESLVIRYGFGSSGMSLGAFYYAHFNQNTTYLVGSKFPNELGLYDMSGNVAEWCDNGLDNMRVYVVGGSYLSDGFSLGFPLKVENTTNPMSKESWIGFRVCKPAD